MRPKSLRRGEAGIAPLREELVAQFGRQPSISKSRAQKSVGGASIIGGPGCCTREELKSPIISQILRDCALGGLGIARVIAQYFGDRNIERANAFYRQRL